MLGQLQSVHRLVYQRKLGQLQSVHRLVYRRKLGVIQFELYQHLLQQ